MAPAALLHHVIAAIKPVSSVDSLDGEVEIEADAESSPLIDRLQRRSGAAGDNRKPSSGQNAWPVSYCFQSGASQQRTATTTRRLLRSTAQRAADKEKPQTRIRPLPAAQAAAAVDDVEFELHPPTYDDALSAPVGAASSQPPASAFGATSDKQQKQQKRRKGDLLKPASPATVAARSTLQEGGDAARPLPRRVLFEDHVHLLDEGVRQKITHPHRSSSMDLDRGTPARPGKPINDAPLALAFYGAGSVRPTADVSEGGAELTEHAPQAPVAPARGVVGTFPAPGLQRRLLKKRMRQQEEPVEEEMPAAAEGGVAAMDVVDPAGALDWSPPGGAAALPASPAAPQGSEHLPSDRLRQPLRDRANEAEAAGADRRPDSFSTPPPTTVTAHPATRAADLRPQQQGPWLGPERARRQENSAPHHHHHGTCGAGGPNLLQQLQQLMQLQQLLQLPQQHFGPHAVSGFGSAPWGCGGCGGCPLALRAAADHAAGGPGAAGGQNGSWAGAGPAGASDKRDGGGVAAEAGGGEGRDHPMQQPPAGDPRTLPAARAGGTAPPAEARPRTRSRAAGPNDAAAVAPSVADAVVARKVDGESDQKGTVAAASAGDVQLSRVPKPKAKGRWGGRRPPVAAIVGARPAAAEECGGGGNAGGGDSSGGGAERQRRGGVATSGGSLALRTMSLEKIEAAVKKIASVRLLTPPQPRTVTWPNLPGRNAHCAVRYRERLTPAFAPACFSAPLVSQEEAEPLFQFHKAMTHYHREMVREFASQVDKVRAATCLCAGSWSSQPDKRSAHLNSLHCLLTPPASSAPTSALPHTQPHTGEESRRGVGAAGGGGWRQRAGLLGRRRELRSVRCMSGPEEDRAGIRQREQQEVGNGRGEDGGGAGGGGSTTAAPEMPPEERTGGERGDKGRHNRSNYRALPCGASCCAKRNEQGRGWRVVRRGELRRPRARGGPPPAPRPQQRI